MVSAWNLGVRGWCQGGAQGFRPSTDRSSSQAAVPPGQVRLALRTWAFGLEEGAHQHHAHGETRAIVRRPSSSSSAAASAAVSIETFLREGALPLHLYCPTVRSDADNYTRTALFPASAPSPRIVRDQACVW
jgi:hypothetical protein